MVSERDGRHRGGNSIGTRLPGPGRVQADRKSGSFTAQGRAPSCCGRILGRGICSSGTGSLRRGLVRGAKNIICQFVTPAVCEIEVAGISRLASKREWETGRPEGGPAKRPAPPVTACRTEPNGSTVYSHLGPNCWYRDFDKCGCASHRFAASAIPSQSLCPSSELEGAKSATFQAWGRRGPDNQAYETAQDRWLYLHWYSCRDFASMVGMRPPSTH